MFDDVSQVMLIGQMTFCYMLFSSHLPSTVRSNTIKRACPLFMIERKMCLIIKRNAQYRYHKHRLSLYLLYKMTMQFPQNIYRWLIHINVIPNNGQLDERQIVTIPKTFLLNFQNGYNIGQIIKYLALKKGQKKPNSLNNVKSDPSKNTKLTNWNFIWLTFDALKLKIDGRIKQLILQGENALIIEVLKQLYEKDDEKNESEMNKIRIKEKITGKKNKNKKTTPIDLKKINLQKDPLQSESSLEYLILLLTSSLSMTIQQILGLFTNQNKYLAHIIVKGINQNFDGIILFYSLLNKYSQKLKEFYENDKEDAESCLYAIKPGFISKEPKVAELAVELYGKLGNIYNFFIHDEYKCINTFMLGIKRHNPLRQSFWQLLLSVIQTNELQFFTKHYLNAYSSHYQFLQITKYIIQSISESNIRSTLEDVGIIANWIDIAIEEGKEQNELDNQLMAFQFIGELMMFLPDSIQQNQEEAFRIFSRGWKSMPLNLFVMVFNEVMIIIEALASHKNPLSRKVYLSIVQILNQIMPQTPKKQYLTTNFLPMISKFPTIPSEYLIECYSKQSHLTTNDFLICCEAIEINEDFETLIKIGEILKDIYLRNISVNYHLGSMIIQIVEKVVCDGDEDVGVQFVEGVVRDGLQCYGNIQSKRKIVGKSKPLPTYNNQKASVEKISKEDTENYLIKQKESQLLMSFISKIVNHSFEMNHEIIKDTLKDKLLTANSHLKINTHKVGSKAIESILAKKYNITRELQNEHLDSYQKKINDKMEESLIKKSKISAVSHIISTKIKTPDAMKKDFDSIVEKRRREEEERKAEQERRARAEEKKLESIRKEMELLNLLRGAAGVSGQLKEFNGWEDYVKQQSKDLQIIPPELIEDCYLEDIQVILKKYHKILRHLFFSYSNTMHTIKLSQKFEDNQTRKQTITVVQLNKMIKDYQLNKICHGKSQIPNLVRDTNVKIMRKREVHELDFNGFQQFIVQFCGLIFTRVTTRTLTATLKNDKTVVVKNVDYRKYPIPKILQQFFDYMLGVNDSKLKHFLDGNHTLNENQKYQLQILNKKLERNPNYILPEGYKKVKQEVFKDIYQVSDYVDKVPQSFAASFQMVNHILRKAFGIDVIEPVSKKANAYFAKPSMMVSMDRQRAMSTMIQRKEPLPYFGFDVGKQAKTILSRALVKELRNVPGHSKEIAMEAAYILNDMTMQIEKKVKNQSQKKTRTISLAKLAEHQKSRKQYYQKKMMQKMQANETQKKKQKQGERRRRQQTERFMEEQKIKYMQKRKRQDAQKLARSRQQDDKKSKVKQTKEKFSQFHQGQLQKIKKIYEEATDKIKKSKQEQEQAIEKKEQLYRKLRGKIQHDDKRIIEIKKSSENKIMNLYDGAPIKETFKRHESNLKAVYDFLIKNTFLSLTERKHNNEIIYETWRYFNIAFELSPIVINAKDIVSIFKHITRDKTVTKQYYNGLNFDQFKQALLRLAIKYRTIFNLVADKIKDKQPSPPKKVEEKKQLDDKMSENSKKKDSKKGKGTSPPPPPKIINQEQNQFDNMDSINIKQLVAKDRSSKDSIEQYPDIDKVTQKTLRGLIYYLKVPNSKNDQEKRFRQILVDRPNHGVQNTQRLKSKLNEQYTLEPTTKKKRTISHLEQMSSKK